MSEKIIEVILCKCGEIVLKGESVFLPASSSELISAMCFALKYTPLLKEYADIILDLLEENQGMKLFVARLYREHTIELGKKYVKGE